MPTALDLAVLIGSLTLFAEYGSASLTFLLDDPDAVCTSKLLGIRKIIMFELASSVSAEEGIFQTYLFCKMKLCVRKVEHNTPCAGDSSNPVH